MKHFLDFGTHAFEGLEEFIHKLGLDKSFNIQCFEPNKIIYEKSLENKTRLENYQKLFCSFKHFNMAVMDYTGDIKFNSHKGAWKDSSKQEYIDNYTTGSNCLDINPACDAGNGVVFDVVTETCSCIDIEDIVSSIVDSDKYAEIYIKCDIEGSEFIVLPRLLNSKYIGNVKCIYTEWHERFWYNTYEYQNKINQRKSITDKMDSLKILNFVHT
jgi:FkbM family methyltransferase